MNEWIQFAYIDRLINWNNDKQSAKYMGYWMIRCTTYNYNMLNQYMIGRSIKQLSK